MVVFYLGKLYGWMNQDHVFGWMNYMPKNLLMGLVIEILGLLILVLFIMLWFNMCPSHVETELSLNKDLTADPTTMVSKGNTKSSSNLTRYSIIYNV
jgi:hypothetical protein